MEQHGGRYVSVGRRGQSVRWSGAPFGVAIASLGLLTFIYSDSVAGLEPIPTGVSGHLGLAYVAAAVLIVGGAGIATRIETRLSAAAVATVLFVWWLLLQIPPLILHPHDGRIWTTAFETMALSGAGCVLASDASASGRPVQAARPMVRVGLVCFGCSVLVFGMLHLVYGDIVASLIPAWLPWHHFWAYGTGFAFLAAAAAILSRMKAHLAAVLLGTMFGIWVLIVHSPRVALDPANRLEWTSLLVALAMCGASWVVASVATESSEV
ncbi:MAG: hypothetical protein ACR2MQ_09915 [Gemmatimonadaceae bacterium]